MAFSEYCITTDASGNPVFGYLNSQTTGASTDWQVFGHDLMLAAVNTVKDKGEEVWVSLGGSSFSFINSITTVEQADAFADQLSDALDHYGLGGVDFSHVSSVDSAMIMERILTRLNTLRTENSALDYKIMYTVPATATYTEPWMTVLASHSFDVVQILAYDHGLYYSLDDDLTNLAAFGVLDSQIVIGIMPGCHDNLDFTSVLDAEDIADMVVTHAYNGVAIWSANRDALVRPYYNAATNPSDCKYYTGQPDGTFMTAVSTRLTS